MDSLRLIIAASILVVIVGRAIGQSTTAVEDCYKIGDYEERCFKTIRSDRGFLMRLWPEAKDLCTEGNDGYTLATIRDDATQEALASFIINYEVTTRNVWIGARQNMNSRWAWLDGTVEPGKHVKGRTHDASVAVLDGSTPAQLMSANFRQRQKYICHFQGRKCNKFANDSHYRRGPNSDCYVTFPRFNTGAVYTWYQARSNCWRLGGDLASSRDVLNVRRNSSSPWLQQYGNYSVGLQRDEYVWVDTGEVLGSYNNFQDGQPRWTADGACVVLTYGNPRVWSSENCTGYPQLFVCSKVRRLTSSTTTDPAGPPNQGSDNDEFQFPTLTFDATIGLIVGVFVFFVLCIIITAVITWACVRGSASKTGSTSARPNDYVEKQKKAPKQKGKKETKETKEKKQKKKTPDTDGQTISNDLHQNNLGFDDQEPFDYQPPINYQYQDPVNYQFAETDLGPNMYNDDKYYPTDSIYTNDPQFQPPLV